jgi:2-methylcitrate dehydratase PrpD
MDNQASPEQLDALTPGSTLVEKLAHFVRHLAFDQVPPDVLATTKLHLLDTLGCAVFAARLPLASALQALASVTSQESSDGYSVIGLGRTPSPGDAALCNGILASAFELDSGGVYVHPGPCVIGAALAAAEYRSRHRGGQTSGREFALALLSGYEVTVRVSAWVGFAAEHDIGWHTPAFHGALGGAVAAARVLGLDVKQTASALALAVDMAGGGLIHSRNDGKRVHTGRAAHSGLISAILAAEGITCGMDVLEHPRWGYYRAMRFGADTLDPSADPNTDKVTAELFTRFDSYDKLAFKYYPFHSAGQTILDTVSRLRSEHAVTPDDVEAVTIHLSSFMYDHDAMRKPAESLATANFSFPYAAALALVMNIRRLTEVGAHADAFLDGFADNRVKQLQRKVHCVRSSELDAENLYTMDTIIDLRLHSGKNLRARTDYGVRARATGSKATIAFDSVTASHIERKFINLCAGVLSDSSIVQVADFVSHLEVHGDMAPLLALLTAVGHAKQERRRKVQ